MADKIRWGVIGSGGIACRRTIPEGIIPAKNAELSVVYDIQSDINTNVASRFDSKTASGLEELFKSDIDAVYIASPANEHYNHVQAAAKAGKHILCEKPLGMTAAEAETMLRICKESGVTLGTAFMMRFQTQHQAAFKMIEDGKLGKPVFCRAQLSCWYPPIQSAWRQDPSTGGGGSLMDMGGHCIDLLEMFFGKIDRVFCQINNIVQNYKSEDTAVATLLFKNGAIGTVDTCFCIPDNSSKNVLELYGSKGSIMAKGTIGQGEAGEMTAFLKPEESAYDATQERMAQKGIVINPKPYNTYRAEIEEFSQALLERREPSIHAALGLRSQKILGACYESSRKGAVIKV